jgi:hypothetical protein
VSPAPSVTAAAAAAVPLPDGVGAGAGSGVVVAPGATDGVAGVSKACGPAAWATVSSGFTPRPTSTPHRKITTDTSVVAIPRKTSCLPFS